MTTKHTPKTQPTEAFKRGMEDGERNRLEVVAGMFGAWNKDDYPSNPFPKSDPRFFEYCSGWSRTGVWQGYMEGK